MDELAEVADLMLLQLQNKSDQLTEIMFRGFVQQIKIFASSQGERTEPLTELKGLLEHVLQDTAVIRTKTESLSKSSITTGLSSDSATLWRTYNAQKWQANLQSAVSPVSASRSAGSSTPGVSHAELGMDSEIVVKIRDEPLRRELRKVQPAEIVQRVERARALAAKSIPSLALAGHAFVAARQLPSGDISLRARHAAGAEVLRQHCKNWVHVFGKSAYVRVPTWGVVIDAIPVKSVDLGDDIEAFKEQLIAENHYAWGGREIQINDGDGSANEGGVQVEIAHVGWLVVPKGHTGSLVIEFTNPIVANNAIRGGTVWQSRSLTNRPYCREGRCKLCKKCQKYGHVHAQCPSTKFYCGLCAEEHPTWECPSKQSRNLKPKCANCKGPHKAVSDNCPIRKDALERARHAVLTCEPLHRVPQYLQQKSTQRTIDPTPSEAARITAAPKASRTTKMAAPKKVAKKATTTTKGKKAQPTKTAPAPEPAPETVPAPVWESTTAPIEAPIVASIEESTEMPMEIVNEVAPVQTGPYTPLRPPTAPQPLTRTLVRGPTKTIPLKLNKVTEKRPRGRPPKSKSSNNDDQDPDLEPQEHIDNVLTASQPNPPTIDPALLENLIPSSTAPNTRSRGLNQPVNMRDDPERPLREQRRRERSRSQSYDNTPLPPPPPINMTIDDNDHCVVLNSVASFREIDSGEINSDVRREMLSRFTTNRDYIHIQNPHHPPIQEEDEGDQSPIQISISTRSTPDALQ
jgi:hypothetical protein